MKIRHALIWLKRQSFAYPMTRVENRKVYTVHLQPLKEKRYKGQVFVLVNGLTASSASMCASFLKYKAQAKIVGEETGGGEAGNSGLGNIEVTLPQTGFRVQIPNFYLNYHVTQDLGRGIRPDIFFESKLASILRGSDDMLEKVFSEL
jgi:C-terminal processing protease CtpA/Prc